jgi:hypothetical protein
VPHHPPARQWRRCDKTRTIKGKSMPGTNQLHIVTGRKLMSYAHCGVRTCSVSASCRRAGSCATSVSTTRGLSRTTWSDVVSGGGEATRTMWETASSRGCTCVGDRCYTLAPAKTVSPMCSGTVREVSGRTAGDSEIRVLAHLQRGDLGRHWPEEDQCEGVFRLGTRRAGGTEDHCSVRRRGSSVVDQHIQDTGRRGSAR